MGDHGAEEFATFASAVGLSITQAILELRNRNTSDEQKDN